MGKLVSFEQNGACLMFKLKTETHSLTKGKQNNTASANDVVRNQIFKIKELCLPREACAFHSASAFSGRLDFKAYAFHDIC
ncbi:hypothetical protein PRUPE_4G260300 [Prunus persica]|uniref:Uncharacterized protein n=1 Tax=Prunus persica TaxID=3760 RepID=M5WW00_PRUPE|nr:hypothetical protein PRUPE_4G260300 [Prunus persica]